MLMITFRSAAFEFLGVVLIRVQISASCVQAGLQGGIQIVYDPVPLPNYFTSSSVKSISLCFTWRRKLRSIPLHPPPTATAALGCGWVFYFLVHQRQK